MDSLIQEITRLTDKDKSRLENSLNQLKKQRAQLFDIVSHLYLIGECHATTSSGTKCSRKCVKVTSDYCHCHYTNPTKYSNARKKKDEGAAEINDNDNDQKLTTDDVDMTQYVKCRLIQIERASYFIDNNGILYDVKNYTISGRKLSDDTSDIVWYS